MKITGQIIGAAIEVHKLLGPGFVESIYQKALLHELHLRGLCTQTEVNIEVTYKEQLVGKHRIDLIVDNRIVVELKAVNGISDVHIAQTISYLKATHLEVALIIKLRRAESVLEKADK